jgi:hypothetical protein
LERAELQISTTIHGKRLGHWEQLDGRSPASRLRQPKTKSPFKPANGAPNDDELNRPAEDRRHGHHGRPAALGS